MPASASYGAGTVILGSRSPRRRELLATVVGGDLLRVLPPLDAEELSFDDLCTDAEIENRLLKVVMMKHQDVRDQLDGSTTPAESTVAERSPENSPVIVVADTLVIATTAGGRRLVLGQPDPARWQDVVRSWFRDLLSGTTHSVWTGFCVSRGHSVRTHIVRTEVSFVPLTDSLIDWYVSTGESPGKAGGYGIQGHAASIVCGLQGSLTNVIGLPVLEVAEELRHLGVSCLVGCSRS